MKLCPSNIVSTEQYLVLRSSRKGFTCLVLWYTGTTVGGRCCSDIHRDPLVLSVRSPGIMLSVRLLQWHVPEIAPRQLIGRRMPPRHRHITASNTRCSAGTGRLQVLSTSRWHVTSLQDGWLHTSRSGCLVALARPRNCHVSAGTSEKRNHCCLPHSHGSALCCCLDESGRGAGNGH